jgi:predicted nucleic acid-binding protein
MVKVLLDSNILVDIMNGVQEARTEVSYYSDITISVVTWMEVMVGCVQTKQTALFQTFLTALEIKVVHTDDVIALKAAQIRAAGLAAIPRRQIKLPDAIIGATAQTLGLMVVTRNPRDFGANTVRVPYQIDASGTAINVLQPPT